MIEALVTENASPVERERILKAIPEMGHDFVMQHNPDLLRDTWGEDSDTQVAVANVAAIAGAPTPIRKAADD